MDELLLKIFRLVHKRKPSKTHTHTKRNHNPEVMVTPAERLEMIDSMNKMLPKHLNVPPSKPTSGSST